MPSISSQSHFLGFQTLKNNTLSTPSSLYFGTSQKKQRPDWFPVDNGTSKHVSTTQEPSSKSVAASTSKNSGYNKPGLLGTLAAIALSILAPFTSIFADDSSNDTATDVTAPSHELAFIDEPSENHIPEPTSSTVLFEELTEVLPDDVLPEPELPDTTLTTEAPSSEVTVEDIEARLTSLNLSNEEDWLAYVYTGLLRADNDFQINDPSWSNSLSSARDSSTWFLRVVTDANISSDSTDVDERFNIDGFATEELANHFTRLLLGRDLNTSNPVDQYVVNALTEGNVTAAIDELSLSDEHATMVAEGNVFGVLPTPVSTYTPETVSLPSNTFTAALEQNAASYFTDIYGSDITTQIDSWRAIIDSDRSYGGYLAYVASVARPSMRSYWNDILYARTTGQGLDNFSESQHRAFDAVISESRAARPHVGI